MNIKWNLPYTYYQILVKNEEKSSKLLILLTNSDITFEKKL